MGGGMSDETKPMPCAICGGEAQTVKYQAVGQNFADYRVECRACANHANRTDDDEPSAVRRWSARQIRIREERAWQLVVALAPAAFPDVKFAGLTNPEIARRWERVWAAARLGVKAARAIAEEAVR
jgi:hypothetical protein